MRLDALFQLENVKTVVGFDHLAHISGAQRLDRFFKHVRKLSFVVARQPALFGVWSIGMKPRYGSKITPSFGHLAMQSISLFSRLNADLAHEETRTIGETGLILLQVLLDFFGRNPHVAQRDLTVVLFDQQIAS